MSLREWTGAASTAEKAVEKGLRKLGLGRDRVEIKILGEKTSGLFSLFGFRSFAVKLIEKPDLRRERFDEDRGRGFRDRGPRDRGFREGGREGRRDERGPRRDDRRREDGGRRRGRGDDRPRGDVFIRNDRGDDRRDRENASKPPPRDDRRDQRPPSDARPRGRGNADERPRDRPRDGGGRHRRPEPAAGRAPETPRAPRGGDVTPVDAILNEWKSLLGWEDLSWSGRNGESGDIVIVFDAASGDRLMENGGRVLEALEHLVNVARAKGDRSVPRVTFQVEGQAPRESSGGGSGGGVVGQAYAAVEEVKRTGEMFRLAPMDSRQRRLVHQALAGHPDVETVSEGEGSNRKIIIKPKSK